MRIDIVFDTEARKFHALQDPRPCIFGHSALLSCADQDRSRAHGIGAHGDRNAHAPLW